ncbi:hypothetical protein C1645_831513 [Glomus cerebriforme]|uniref:Sel1 repeat protein n=1 Tax=Glomus cerebriforme TaxID=658196 RepID=A0A397SHE3_9GLOM|nr:hypothetical protein C1645_831513 [Glomus cerebriforme]
MQYKEDEINVIENYFEKLNKDSSEIQIGYYDSKKRELIEINNLGYYYQYGIGRKKDEFKAFEFCLRSAEEGNVGAQNNLGYCCNCYQNGIGIEKDLEKAIYCWYKKAAENGNEIAQYNLGRCYSYGKKMKLTTEDDNKLALYKLGEFYESGKGVYFNEKRAFEFCKKSVDQRSLLAWLTLGPLEGHIYNHGTQIEINEKKAFDHHKMEEMLMRNYKKMDIK